MLTLRTFRLFFDTLLDLLTLGEISQVLRISRRFNIIIYLYLRWLSFFLDLENV